MSIYYINASGTDMGEYEAENANEALDAYAMDAGYTDFADAQAQFPSDVSAIEIDTDALAAAVAAETGSAVFQDSYGSGAALVDGVSYDTHDDMAKLIGKRAWDFRA